MKPKAAYRKLEARRRDYDLMKNRRFGDSKKQARLESGGYTRPESLK